MMCAFGGKGLRATSIPELDAALAAAIHSALNDRVCGLAFFTSSLEMGGGCRNRHAWG